MHHVNIFNNLLLLKSTVLMLMLPRTFKFAQN